MTTAVTITKASKNLNEIATATAQGKSFLLTQNKKPLAAVISPRFFATMVQFIEKYDPGLADTLAISVNPEIDKLLDESRKNAQDNDTVPFA